jgi:dephospho-CoA kinase
VTLPFRIGLTGGIGTGKSFAAEELRKFGSEIVSGDELGRQAVDSSPDLLQQIRGRYGNEVFDPNGKLIRRALGLRIFADPAEVQWLTSATFPRIHRLWLDAIGRTDCPVIVLDAALIFEWGIEKEFDLLIVVRAPLEQVQARLEVSGRLSAAEARSRLTRQMSPDSKASSADVTIDNQGNPEQLRAAVQQLWKDRIEPEVNRRRTQAHESSR